MTEMAELVQNVFPHALRGSVTQVIGETVAVGGFPAPLGATAVIARECGPPVEAEVIGFQGAETLLLSDGEFSGIRRGSRVQLNRSTVAIHVGQGLLGRVINSRGRPIDSAPLPVLYQKRTIAAPPPSPMQRPPIDQPLATGVQAIDTMLTLGKGQRVGIFSGSGVGKSTLLGQIARSSQADMNVIALVGERGREVREFLERDLGPEGLARSVVVVATGDEPALHRYRAALAATTIAEYFRDLGRDVMLMMDSVTRFALAQRNIGFARGEVPVTRGYPPSVFTALPQLLERSGRGESGSITGIYTVLVEGDDMNEPIADTVRGTLDGHIILSRKLAQQAHWPAIDVLGSVSRLMPQITEDTHRRAADHVRELLAAYREAEDMILVGAYQSGTNPLLDKSIQLREAIGKLLRQAASEQRSFQQSISQLIQMTRQSPQPNSAQSASASS